MEEHAGPAAAGTIHRGLRLPPATVQNAVLSGEGDCRIQRVSASANDAAATLPPANDPSLQNLGTSLSDAKEKKKPTTTRKTTASTGQALTR